MLDIFAALKVPQESIVNRDIPLDKFPIANSSLKNNISEVKLLATIKPEFIGASPSANDKVRYEEIQIISLVINDPDGFINDIKPIFKEIRYPILMLCRYNNKFRFVTCAFKPGKIDYAENILSKMDFSSWVYPDEVSDRADRCIKQISESWGLSTLEEVYRNIRIAVNGFYPYNLTRDHTYAVLKAAGLEEPDYESVLKYCTVYKKHSHLSAYNKYDSRKTKSFVYRYDIEDIWYGMLKDEKASRIIQNKRYRNVEDFLLIMDEKLYGNQG